MGQSEEPGNALQAGVKAEEFILLLSPKAMAEKLLTSESLSWIASHAKLTASTLVTSTRKAGNMKDRMIQLKEKRERRISSKQTDYVSKTSRKMTKDKESRVGNMSNFLPCLPTFNMALLTAAIAVLVAKRKNMHIKHAYRSKQKAGSWRQSAHMSKSPVTDATLRRHG